MLFRDVVKSAHSLVSQDNVIVDRGCYVARNLARVDRIGETILEAVSSSTPLKLVAIGPLLKYIGAMSPQYSITVQPVREFGPSRGVYGYVDIRKNSAAIVYSGALNFCWERFTVTKELMHLYIRFSFGDKSIDDVDLGAANVLSDALASRSVTISENAMLSDEAAALYMAFEVLFPWSLRTQYNRMLDLGATNMQIAKAFMIPVNFIEFFRHNESKAESYFQLSERINSDVAAQK